MDKEDRIAIAGLNAQITLVGNEIAAVKQQVADLGKNAFADVRRQLDRLDARLSELGKRLENIEGVLDKIRGPLEDKALEEKLMAAKHTADD